MAGGLHPRPLKDQVIEALRQLVRSYPDIEKWIGTDGDPKSVWSKIQGGKYHLSVARMGSNVVGFCLSQRKDARNAKISTFYAVRKYRHQHIGHRLLRQELERMADAGIRRVMVTFGHEEFDSMHPFFEAYGFTVDGISPQRYRDNSYEVIMGKRFHQGDLDLGDFTHFVQHDVFLMQGYEVEPLEEDTFLACPRQDLFAMHQLPAGRSYLVRATVSPTPEDELKETREAAKKHGADPVLVAAHGFPAGADLPSNLLVMDALILERQFYPLTIERPHDHDLIIPIRPAFAKRLMPKAEQSTLAPDRVGLRTENVYYKAKGRGTIKARRGCRIFFYESKGRGIIGYGRLQRVDSGTPRKLHARFGGLGAWSDRKIADHTGDGDAEAYRFERFVRFPSPIGLDRVKTFHERYNPITTYRVPRGVGNMLIQEGTT